MGDKSSVENAPSCSRIQAEYTACSATNSATTDVKIIEEKQKSASSTKTPEIAAENKNKMELLRNIRNRNQLVEKIPRVFLLTNDDDTDVEDVTDVNDEDDVCWKDFLSKEYDDNLFNFFFVLTCRSALLAIVEL